MTREEKVKFLEDHGWHSWYSPNYWVNPKTIEDSERQNYTNYGMDIDTAYRFETEDWKKFKSCGLPELSKYLYDWNMC